MAGAALHDARARAAGAVVPAARVLRGRTGHRERAARQRHRLRRLRVRPVRRRRAVARFHPGCVSHRHLPRGAPQRAGRPDRSRARVRDDALADVHEHPAPGRGAARAAGRRQRVAERDQGRVVHQRARIVHGSAEGEPARGRCDAALRILLSGHGRAVPAAEHHVDRHFRGARAACEPRHEARDDMIFSLPFLLDTVMPKLLAAVPTTLALTLVSGAASLLLGVLLALAAGARHTPLRWSARGWLMLIRGTPLLVQLYLLYYGFGQIVPREWMRDSWASPLLRDAFWYAIVALSVNESAYVATILRGAIAGVPAGEIEAGHAYGMTRLQVLRRIVGPRAWRLALPALTGEAILLLKSTVLASTVTVFDVMGTANRLRFETLRVYEPLAGAAIVYVVLVALLTIPAARLEQRINRYLTRQPDERVPARRRRASSGAWAAPN
ncbi:ABC-type arginine/histidine transport system, permease component [Burkholderia cenocepacia PC184]|nr:ABC-type arginine/histidine transport system, permease component [Burkholderia cenocepacia PC184]